MQNLLEIDIQKIRDLQFDFKVEECRNQCLAILESHNEKPNYEVRSIYGFCEQFSDPKKSFQTLFKVFEESPYFFKNTTYLLHILSQQYSEKSKKLSKEVITLYSKYEGEKDIYYYLSLSIAEHNYNPDNNSGLKNTILQGYKAKFNKKDVKEEIEDEGKSQDERFEEILKDLKGEETAWIYHHLGNEKLYQYLLDQENKQVYDESVDMLQKSLEIQPNNTLTMQLLALLLVQDNQQQEEGETSDNLDTALGIYHQALQINPHDLLTNVYYCELLIKIGEYAQCEEVLQGILEYKQTPYVFNKYLQYVSFSHQYRFKDRTIDFENIFSLLFKMIEYDGEDYYNFDSFSILLYLLQHSKAFQSWKGKVEEVLELLTLSYPNILTNINQLTGFEPLMQSYLDLLIQRMQEEQLKIHTLNVYNKLIEPEITYMGKYSHWDSYFE